MAIQKSVVDIYGSTHPEAYIVVGVVHITRARLEPLNRIQISIFHDAAARSKDNVANMKMPLYEQMQSMPRGADSAFFNDTVLKEEGKTPFTQAYAWLKTQSDIWGIDFTTGTTDV